MKEGQTESMASILYYLRLLEKLYFLREVKENIFEDIYKSERKIRSGIASMILTNIFTKAFVDMILITTIIALLFIFNVSNSEVIILVLLAVRFVPVFQNLISSINKFASSSEVIEALFNLVIK